MGKGDEKGPKCSLSNTGTQRKGVRRQICLLDYSKDVHSSLLHPHQPCPEPENGLWAKRKPWASQESLHTWQGHDKDKAESAPAPGGEGALRAGWWSRCQNQLLETMCLSLPHSLLPGAASRAFRDQACFGFEPTEGRGISQKDAPAWHSVPLVTSVSCPGRHLCSTFLCCMEEKDEEGEGGRRQLWHWVQRRFGSNQLCRPCWAPANARGVPDTQMAGVVQEPTQQGQQEKWQRRI